MQKEKKKNFINFLAAIFLIAGFFVASINAQAAFFTDGFESGDLSHTENGAFWFSGGGQDATVSSTRAHSGTRSMRFEYAPEPDHLWSEERFNLGDPKTDVYIQYWVWFDSNYVHASSGNNNKFIRIWSENSAYEGDPVKMGASLLYDATYMATMQGEMGEAGGDTPSCLASIGQFHTLGTWPIAENLGRWALFEWHFKLDSGAGDGALELWVDGVKEIDGTSLSFIGAPCGAEGSRYFRVGYLFGYDNARFAETTYMYVDDVKFSDTYIGNGSADSTPPAAPGGLAVS